MTYGTLLYPATGGLPSRLEHRQGIVDAERANVWLGFQPCQVASVSGAGVKDEQRLGVAQAQRPAS